MTLIDSAQLTTVDVPIRQPRRHSDGVTTSARRGILRIRTEDGTEGVGEISPRSPREATRSVLAALPGTSVFDTTKLRLHIAAGKFPVQARSVLFAGIEMALLDIQGKLAGLPVHQLLGGAMRTEIPLIAYVFRSGAPEQRGRVPVEELAAAAVEEFGFETVKLKAGAVPPEDDLETAGALRERYPDLRLRVDPNGIWSVPTTVRLARRIEALDLEWLEDPVLTSNAMSQVRRRTGLCLATNMCLTSRWDLADAMPELPVDVVLLDLWYLGGLREALNFQSTLDTFKLGVGVHSGGGSGELGIGQAAELHLAAALPSLPFAADSMYHHLSDDILETPHVIENGRMRVPQEPGLGVRIDDKKLARYAVEDGLPAFRRYSERRPRVYPSY